MNETKKNIFVRIKDWFINLFKAFWRLGLDAKIGILFLSPSIYSFIDFVLLHGRWFFDQYYYNDNDLEVMKMKTLYYGLLAIAGAHLIKGNLGKKE